ncbi:MAG: acyl transferase [Bacteroidetes bacterium]|nr:acyl transferase [Bacteroidota bacterium]
MRGSPVAYDTLFSIKSDTDFNDTALAVFRYQHAQNKTYREFCDLLHVKTDTIHHFTQIPFLPIQFFKTHRVVTGTNATETTFYSSGTTQSNLSEHHVTDLALYDQSLLNGFELAFGPVSDYAIFALLPSYHTNKNASLLYMVDKLIAASGNRGGFFLENHAELLAELAIAKISKKVILIGVSYALLDLADTLQPDLRDIIILETGGMKGRRKEMIKTELHAYLKARFQVASIGSEYGMTELLSQAWSRANGVFHCPPWMKILTREYNDPFSFTNHKTGGINVIDLANLHSCSFIATQDLGIVTGSSAPLSDQFEIAGRFDNADLRGCNLLVG